LSALLIDASVIGAAFDRGDGHHDAARAVMTEGLTTLATLDLARYEVANMVVRAWQQPEALVPLLSAVERIAADGGLVVSNDSLLRDAAAVASRYGITVYDAAYAAAASVGGRLLVSCDVRDLVSNGLAVLPSEVAGAS
jgi:predicted nucleic acid-binding protein